MNIYPFKAVSLLAILKHDAAAFWSICQTLEKALTEQIGGRATAAALHSLREQCRLMGLSVSDDQITSYMDKGPNKEDWHAFISKVSSVIQSELKTRIFVYISEDRSTYLEGAWYDATPILFSFTRSDRELQAAGRCYAYGEPDASVFHSMRALEPCIRALAIKLDVYTETDSWQQLINNIESKIRDIGKTKVQGQKITAEQKADIRFYSEIATRFAFMKDAWRNDAMHGRRSYSDRDAKDIMDAAERILYFSSDRLDESDEPASLRASIEESPKGLPRGDEAKA
jgi:HEPN domain-containing protein